MLDILVAITSKVNQEVRETGVSKIEFIRDRFGLRDSNKAYSSYSAVKMLMDNEKVEDFLRVYPVKKRYDGKRFCEKDYFSSMDYIRSMDSDVFTEDNILEFLLNVELEEDFFNLLGRCGAIAIESRLKERLS